MKKKLVQLVPAVYYAKSTQFYGSRTLPVCLKKAKINFFFNFSNGAAPQRDRLSEGNISKTVDLSH